MQGDVLSPLLFGLYIDRLEPFLTQRLGPNIGAQLAGRVVRVLLYADDLVLLAHSPDQLQQMLDALAEFCKACMMTVNVKKTEIVCFNNQHTRARPYTWQYMGQIVPIVAEFKYLGILFGENGVCGGMWGARDRQLKAGRFVLSEMRKRTNKLRISNVRTLCYLYDI